LFRGLLAVPEGSIGPTPFKLQAGIVSERNTAFVEVSWSRGLMRDTIR
jgi:hypothetical protein